MSGKDDPPLHTIRIDFSGVKRYRDFLFLPRVGDRINITDDSTTFCLAAYLAGRIAITPLALNRSAPVAGFGGWAHVVAH